MKPALSPLLRNACLIALPLALAACQGGDSPAAQATAAGEILPGSASDAMLPLDTIRSQPPLAQPPGERGTHDVREGDTAAPADKPAAEATPAPDPEVSAPKSDAE